MIVPVHESSAGAVEDVPDRAHVYRRRLRTDDDIVDLEHFVPTDFRPASTIHGVLAVVAAEHPAKEAMIVVEPPDFLRPARTVTYGELIDSIEQAACLFHDCAGASTSVVALMLPMCPEGLICTWAAQTAGIALPLNPFLELGAFVRLAARTKITTLVTDRATLEAKSGGDVDALLAQIPTLSHVFYVDDVDPDKDLATAMRSYVGAGLDFRVDEDPRRDAMYMPTGGTTGSPKLVRMSQGEQLTVAWNVGALMGPEPDGVVGHGMPNFHCGGTISLGLRAMVFGQTLLTLTSVGFRSRPMLESFWDIVGHYKMTSLLATPTTAQALLTLDRKPPQPNSLIDFYVGGSTVPMELVRSFHRTFGIWMRENWGATEFHGTITGHPNDGQQPVVGSVGIALPHARVRSVVLDSAGQYVRDCEPDERGVLLIGGPFVTQGYLNADLDDSFFVCGVPGSGSWGNTGDLGTIDVDGYVWVFGRAKDLIIRGGHNIDPKEIEEALLLHPDVQSAAAIGRPDSSKGELPIAYVQPKTGRTLDPVQLIAFCRERVQESAATPVDVIVIDEMPLTPVGKVSKPVLRKLSLENEVRNAVSSCFRGLVDCMVRIDESGPRPRVHLDLGAAAAEDPDGVERLRKRLGGYEFAFDLTLAGVHI